MYGNSGAGSDRHLTEDQFEDLLREDLSPAGRQILRAHLSTCPDCRQAFDDYRAIAEILSNLPQVAVPRSFQLTPEMARVDGSLWRRLAAFLFPMLPAMRAATLALVLMLGAVTAARLVEDQADSPDSVEFASDLVPTSTAVQQPAPANAEPESGGALATETTGPAARKDPDDVNDVMMSGADEAPNDAADEASRSGPADEGADPAGSGPADGDAVIEESSQTGPADDVSDPAGTGPIDESDAVDESSGTGPADEADPAGSGPADEAEMESLEMEAPPGDAPAETTESFESAPADEDASGAAGSTEMQLPGVASPEATATSTASPTPSPTHSATATVTPSPPATVTVAPTATATATPTPQDDDDGLDFGDWPLDRLQVVLGALVLLLGTIIVAVSRMGRR